MTPSVLEKLNTTIEDSWKIFAEACRYTALHSRAAPLVEKLTSARMQEKIAMAPHVGYWPDLENPRSYNEHIVHRKLYTDNAEYASLSDKYAVRSYVEDVVGDQVLNELYYASDDPNDIPFNELPESFVMKANHGSGLNKIIDNKSKFDYNELRELCKDWLETEYGENTNEYWYGEIEPKVIVENRLTDKDHGVPLDYKFHVFNGTAEYVQVDIGRFEDHSRKFYTLDWEPAEFELKYPMGPDIAEPDKLEEMQSVAEKLAVDYDYLRVDLYQPDGEEVVFGEITVAPGAGHERFTPKEWDFRLGRLWG